MKRAHDGEELQENRADLVTTQKTYDKAFPFFRKPQVLGGFSLDSRRQFQHDRRHLKFYKMRGTATSEPVAAGAASLSSSHSSPVPSSEATYRVNIDLNEGVDRANRKDEDETAKEGLANMFRWILVNRQKFLTPTEQLHHPGTSPPLSLNTDFVCYRGCLTTVMCSPFEAKEDWRITAVKHRGTIYLHKEETSLQREQRQRATDRQRAMCSWGYKFEQQMLSDNPGEARRVAEGEGTRNREPVNEAEEFCCVFRTRLGKYSIVYGAEMDGVAVSDAMPATQSGEELELNQEEFVELKTTRQMEHPGHERTFRRFKLIKWWCQSFLVGIGTVVAGFRNDAGVVHTVAEYPVRDLPKHCSDHWKPNVCMNFLHEFLGHVKESLVGTPDLREVHFFWSPRLSRVVREESSPFQQQRMLPEWFLQNVFAATLR